MGMGIVSEAEFDLEKSRLIREESNSGSNPSNIKQANISETRIVEINKGRGNGNINVPNGLRKIIGEESEINGRQSGIKLAQHFGISPASTSAYANGANSTASYDEPNRELFNHINNAKERISKKARNKLILALNHLTPQKLESAKATELSGVAKDMSAIIKNMEPDTPKSNYGTSSPTFVFYAPQFKDERSFDIIQAKE